MLTVRQTIEADIPAVREMQRRAYPGMTPWTEEQLRSHLRIFPEGQIVAMFNDQVVGTAATLIILWDDYGPDHDWPQVTGGGTFSTHNPNGFTLYGAEVSVDPSMQKKGIGQALYKARRDLCRRLNLKRIIAGGRLPNYHKYKDQMSPHLYAMKVIWGDIYDPVLRFQLRQGFQYCQIIQHYFMGDRDSLEYAALICWLNPDYNPRRPSGVRPAVHAVAGGTSQERADARENRRRAVSVTQDF